MLKRKQIASFCFDLETTNTAFNVPVISLFWDLTNSKKPFQLVMRNQWTERVINYPFKTAMKYFRGKTIAELAFVEFKEHFPDYKGKKEISDYYLSEKGKCILCANTQKQVEDWIKKGQI